ncbi:hypothetical protein BGW80DRAFT_1315477 [Lactifluus volemus]|nr:hypothetical protein BGW80DRAFT_1315477 [Lactifluus volemus]
MHHRSQQASDSYSYSISYLTASCHLLRLLSLFNLLAGECVSGDIFYWLVGICYRTVCIGFVVVATWMTSLVG